MSASDEASCSQPADQNAGVNIFSHRDDKSLTRAANKPSTSSSINHNDASAGHGNVNEPVCATDEPFEIQNVGDNNPNSSQMNVNNSRRSTCSQVAATLIQNMLIIDIGMELTMPTLVLGALYMNSEENLSMNDDQASWFGSIPNLFHPIGSLLSGFLQEQFGRKWSMILVNIPLCAAWITLYLAQSVYALYAVNITLGLCCGLVEAPIHSYIGEIGEPHLRGTLSSLSTTFLSLGYLLTYFLGYNFNWRTAALITSAVPVVTLVCMTLLPESPTWLIKRNRLDDAQKSLSWLRGWVKPEVVDEEFQDLVNYIENSVKGSDSAVNEENGYLKMKLKEITNKKVLLPLRMVFIVFIISAVTSILPLQPYMVEIIKGTGSPINSMLLLIIGSLALFVGGVLNMILLRHFGKRKMALFAHGLSTVSILLMGIHYSYLKGSDWFPGLIWLPVILLIFVQFCAGLCTALLPWQLVCEVFPVVGRGIACGVASAWTFLVYFIMSKSYLYLEAWITLSGVLYLYGATAFLGVLYLYLYLPETEGKSLELIETYFTDDHDREEKFSIGKPLGPFRRGKERYSFMDTM